MSSETVTGVIRRVFYSNAESPSMAGAMETANKRTVRFQGKCFGEVGDKIELVGSWIQHPKFGKQFSVESGLVRMDQSPDALIHLLASHKSFEGLGPARARKVVDAAMSLTEDGEISSALRDYSHEIAAESGVKLEIVEQARDVWSERKGFFDAVASLAEQGWTSGQASRIVKRLGENAATLVRADPYMLIKLIPRFGFKTVDAISHNLGIPRNAPMRLQAGIAYCLDQLANDGHTWTTKSGLLQSALEELRPDSLGAEDEVRDSINHLVAEGILEVNTSPIGDEIISDARVAQIEIEVFDRLIEGLNDNSAGQLTETTEELSEIALTLNSGQAAALAGFSTRRFSVLSGGAGVGKTYLMNAIKKLAEANGLTVALCAPSGKAARKLSESAQSEAFTIHRLLESAYDDETGSFYFRRNAENFLDESLVIVDELSMTDLRLMRSLLIALPPGCRLLMVGDHHQIPSVGAGAILRDILSAKDRYPQSVHILEEIVRSAGVLARNTSAILEGGVALTSSSEWDVQKTTRGDEISTAHYVSQIAQFLVTSPEVSEFYGEQPDFAWDVQILAPQRTGDLGTYALNVELQKLRQQLLGNAPPPETEKGKSPKPLPGDRVIWTKNDYVLELFNGTQAIVKSINKGGSMDLKLDDGRDVTIPPGKRLNIEVAYAMTIHKSQGSEWPFVILVASSLHHYMHDRNLLYTGASRASKSLTIVGDIAGISHFAKHKKSEKRQTLGAYLAQGWEPSRRDDELQSA